jgi:hypothetical protein
VPGKSVVVLGSIGFIATLVVAGPEVFRSE